MNEAFKTKKLNKRKNTLTSLLPELYKAVETVKNEKTRFGSVGWIVEMMKDIESMSEEERYAFLCGNWSNND